MKEKGFHQEGAYTLLAPVDDLPELITSCPRCGGEIALWTGEEETKCLFCGNRIFERETTTH